ncbi:MAG: hypothetical protein K2Q34_08915 [Alphaproteobacteria bacterium]|nr:hypothetical protein [Alphaproteobacteria bacterium]
MVNSFSSFKIKRGRPSKEKRESDKGTPELQEKRRAILLSHLNQTSLTESDDIQSKIKGGCLLHRLYIQGELTERQLKIGISLRKLYHKAFRSMGIQTHLKSINGRLGQLKGRNLEAFESPLIEKKWRMIANFLSNLKHSRKISSNILSLILYDEGEITVNSDKLAQISIKMVQSTLDEIEKMINKWN